MTATQIAKAETLIILVRYTIKKTHTDSKGVTYTKGSVILLVRNGEGREYYVTLNRNKQHTCTCDAFTKGHGRHQCYHVEVCRTTENTRRAEAKARVEQAEATRQAAEAELDRIVAEAEADMAREQATITEAERTLAAAGFMRRR